MCDWLAQLNLAKYWPFFREQKLTAFEQRARHTWEDLEEVGISKLGDFMSFFSLRCFEFYAHIYPDNWTDKCDFYILTFCPHSDLRTNDNYCKARIPLRFYHFI